MKLPTAMLRRFAGSLAEARGRLLPISGAASDRWQRLGLRTRVLSVCIVVLVVGLLLFAHPVWLALATAWHWLSLADAWDWYQLNRDDITPLGTFALAAVVAWAALAQAHTARLRHEKQTEADRPRRITESFS